jgi:hypothetical protein
LINDLEDRGIDPARVQRVDNVHQLLVKLQTPEQQALEQARAILGDGALTQRLVARISLDASWTPGQWDSVADWNLGVEVEELTLVAFDATELELESAELDANGELTMLLHGAGEGSFDCFVEKSEIIHAADGSPVEVYDSDWNERYVWAQATLPARAEIDVRVRGGDDFATSIESLEPA